MLSNDNHVDMHFVSLPDAYDRFRGMSDETGVTFSNA